MLRISLFLRLSLAWIRLDRRESSGGKSLRPARGVRALGGAPPPWPCGAPAHGPDFYPCGRRGSAGGPARWSPSTRRWLTSSSGPPCRTSSTRWWGPWRLTRPSPRPSRWRSQDHFPDMVPGVRGGNGVEELPLPPALRATLEEATEVAPANMELGDDGKGEDLVNFWK